MTDTRERIIESGSQAMTAKSYNGVGLNEILCKAGVPKGSFYHHFGSKEDLGVAVIERAVECHNRRLREFFSDRSVSPVERLRRYYRCAIEHLEGAGYNQECLIAKLALELGNLSDTMRAAIRCGMDQWRSITAQCIREAQVQGEVRPEHDPEALADFMICSFEGVMIRMQVDRCSRPAEEYLHFVFGVLLKA